MSSRKRQSPAASATLFPVGTIKPGQDGNKWIIKANKNGVHHWTKMPGAVTHRKTSKRETKWRAATGLFTLYIKQSKQCQGQELGKCDPYMKDNALYDVYWHMGFPNNPANKNYDTSITFDGTPDTQEAAKAIVQKEYEKIKKRGAITKFIIKDE